MYARETIPTKTYYHAYSSLRSYSTGTSAVPQLTFFIAHVSVTLVIAINKLCAMLITQIWTSDILRLMVLKRYLDIQIQFKPEF